jgi:hypothetical protein
VVVLVVFLMGCAAPTPQVELLIPVNAKCTTCEDFIRCEGNSGNAAVYDPSFDIYRLEPKGTLAQLATVWEFLIQLFYTRTEDIRPLSIYAQRPGETEAFKRSTTNNAEARIDLVRHRINLPDGWIDQVTGERHGADDALRGSCRVMAPADGRELLKLFAEQTTGANP